ncbi:MAG: lipoprotein insertase outer membrane protein LolB [Pseudomonadota bacterium]
MRTLSRSALLGGMLLGLLWLGGCASLPETDESMTPSTTGAMDSDAQRLELWLNRQRAMQKLDHWRSEGRAAILAQNGGGQISFDWQHKPNEQILSIKTPLGQNALQLTINPGGATLVDHEGQVLQGEDGESLLQQALGWSVPIEFMRAWLLGLPATRSDSYTLDAQGRLLTLESQGWVIEYKRYGNDGETSQGFSLPSKLELRRSELTLRLVIDRWQM